MAKQMLKRKDGSVSQRGLWDNIRAKKGSGKKPTAAMLKQEKKIKAQSDSFTNLSNALEKSYDPIGMWEGNRDNTLIQLFNRHLNILNMKFGTCLYLLMNFFFCYN
jgi:hypothetical protein